MKNQKNLTVFFLLSALIAATLSFTNMTNSNSTEGLTREEIINSSKALNTQINNPQFSQNARLFFRRHKVTILNYLAAFEKVQSCNQLKQLESTVLSGVYTLFPLAKPKGQIFLCEYTGSFVTQTFLKDVEDVQARCLENGGCLTEADFYTEVNCIPTSGNSPVYCPVEGVYGVPTLVSAANSYCTDSNFGFDQNGLWVKGGCRGLFRMTKVPTANFTGKLVRWPAHGTGTQYRLDIMHKSQPGPYITLTGCITGSSLVPLKQSGTEQVAILTGFCTSNVQYKLTNESRVRVCELRPTAPTQLCSSYFAVEDVVDIKMPLPHEVGNIIGALDTAQVIGPDLIVRGWACHIGDARSIGIHIYQKYQAGQGGVYIGGGAANISHKPGVSIRCMGGGVAHRYAIKIPTASKPLPSNAPLYVYGISLIPGKTNAMLGNSGNVKIPVYVGSPLLCTPSTVRCNYDQRLWITRDALGCEVRTCMQVRSGSDR